MSLVSQSEATGTSDITEIVGVTDNGANQETIYWGIQRTIKKVSFQCIVCVCVVSFFFI